MQEKGDKMVSLGSRWKLLLVGVLALFSLSFASMAFASGAAVQPLDAPDPDVFSSSNADYFWKVPTDKLGYSVTQIVLLIASVVVLLTQFAFPMLERGLGTQGNSQTLAMRSLMFIAFGAVVFFYIGYGFYNPGEQNKNSFFAINESRSFAIEPWQSNMSNMPNFDFLYHLACGCLAASIAAAGLGGRGKFAVYPAIAIVVIGFVFPICNSWLWSGGWLSRQLFYDFGGSGLVHMLGGFAALAGAIMVGPRIDRFSGKDGSNFDNPNHSGYATLGALILLVGCLGLNAGRQFDSVPGAIRIFDVDLTGKILLNSILAAAAACIVGMVLGFLRAKAPSTAMTIRGLLGGLVAIAAGCNVVDPKSALIIGAIAGLLVFLASIALEMFRIDDVLGVFPVHGVCGAWGLLAVAAFGSFVQLNYAASEVRDLQDGDQVVTHSGLTGKIVGNVGATATLEIAKDVKVRIDPAAVRFVQSRTPKSNKPAANRRRDEAPAERPPNVKLLPVYVNPYATFDTNYYQMLIRRAVNPKSMLKNGDILFALNGTKFEGTAGLNELIAPLANGSALTFDVLRGNKMISINLQKSNVVDGDTSLAGLGFFADEYDLTKIPKATLEQIVNIPIPDSKADWAVAEAERAKAKMEEVAKSLATGVGLQVKGGKGSIWQSQLIGLAAIAATSFLSMLVLYLVLRTTKAFRDDAVAVA